MAISASLFSSAARADIVSLGKAVTDVRAKALVAGVINASGPNASKINATLAKYATIPSILSGYQQPAVIADKAPLAKDNVLFGPIIEYLDKALDEFCNGVLFLIIKDNIDGTDAGKIDAIKNLILSFLTFINEVPTKIKIPSSLLDSNFGETSSRLSDVLSKKLGVTIVPPNGITYQELSPIADVLDKTAVAVRASLTAIVTAKAFDKHKSQNNITLIKTIPFLLEKLALLSDDPFALKYLPKFSADVHPIPEPTNSLFTNLTLQNFSTSLSQPNTGIVNYFITSTLSKVSNGVKTQLVTMGSRVHGRAFQTFEQIHLLSAKLVLTIRAYVTILNTIINTFKIRLQDNPAGLTAATAFNAISTKSGFVINLVPMVSGGKRKRRSRKPRQRGRRSRCVKNLTPK